MPSNFVSQLEQKDEQVRNYIKEKEQDCEKLKNELEKLQQDFIYNLQLLNDRDRELATFEDTILELRNNIGERDARINHVSILLDEKSQLVENLKVFVKESEQARVNLLQKEKVSRDVYSFNLDSC